MSAYRLEEHGWILTPEGLLIAPVCLSGFTNLDDYKAMSQDFADALQAARNRREGVVAPDTRPTFPGSVDLETFWNRQTATVRVRFFREAGNPEDDAGRLAEVPFAKLSQRLRDLIRAEFP